MNGEKILTPEGIAKKWLQVTKFNDDLAKDIQAYGDSRVKEIQCLSINSQLLKDVSKKLQNEIQAVSINDDNEMLKAIGKGKFYCNCPSPNMQKPISETEYECFDCGREVK